MLKIKRGNWTTLSPAVQQLQTMKNRGKMKNPAAISGVSDRSKQDLSVIVGWVEAWSADTHRPGMMGIADAQPILRRNRNVATCAESNPR